MKIVSRQESQKINNVSGEPNIQVDSPFGETSTDPKLFFVTVSSYLSNSKPDEVLMFTDNSMIELSDTEETIYKIWKRFDSEIVFAATSDFDYKSKALRYFYWKFYPRQKSFYDFLDARLFVGRASDLLDMVNDIISNYDLKGAFAINDLFHRIYVDTQTGLVKAKYKITLDHLHMLAGSVSGRVAFFRWPLISKTHSILFFKEEEKMLKPYQWGAQNKARDYQEQNLRRFNKKTNTFPAVFIGKEKEKLGRPLFGWMLSLAAYLKTLHLLLVITIFNKGVISQEKIFRYSQNKGKEVNESISGIIQLLRIKQPFSFSHFNDGEMTFIKKYLKKDHKEVWFGGTLFGRFQDQYNEKLGKLLVDSFEMQQEHYFIGTPCKACHPRLHAFASEVRKSDAYTIPAMTFHHNLSYYPEILGLIKERKTYFVVNPYQNLSFFKDIGFTIGYDQHIKVPFKNAHNKFENLKELRFDEGSVVFLMCGMLAKVLCAHWYKHQPSVTFIAFGSSFDDLIQENINFRLFPKEYPFSRNIIGSRGYLFGAKQKCPVCFDLNNSATEIS